MSKIVRVYHPTTPSFQDVPAGAVKDWEDQGWLSKSPGLVDESEHVGVGDYFIASVSADPSPEAAPVEAVKAPAKADK